ncbi:MULTISPECIES: amidophosphoribosyltransferase [Corynebacterium]|uniref:amidophosphoribosyltransferase n=1 Tax=Corynebacterium TaxID=1716 RepID=UPI0006673E5B|nr:amidophosphoribosyltransferase [Corynebacterium amycolatum]OFL73061.1 amidophosphoribosyltransferase [Corynebacterium sp. HMSC063G05]OFL74895.1 amidophosphoribosyltransferase [Corynebacterium sp. HMSC077C02]OFM17278.1 amidophosphoribosyltransferase [Corynebacterium sp. HMSC077G01]OFM54306.1 amidophosphoribosyltransferase [Corynebacterium sp. HMSC064H12]OFN38860.1 amidophosphoribosyltransferase [Corynebacterium sp. HMSC077G07]OFN51616.1 amidophosphoribosyltransferase [Corynebacterium sp. HM
MNVVADTNISGAPKSKLLPISPYDDLGETSPREECGVFGVWAPGEDVSKLTYYGLFALQHRGQEAAGIAVGDGDQILVFKDLGLVSQVFDEQTLDALKGHVAVGHTRYTTAGAPAWENAQPMFQMASDGTDIALGHNGNLTNHLTLFHEAVDKGLLREEGELPSDSAIMTTLLADETGKIDHPEDYGCSTNVEAAAMALLPRLKGAFCLTFTDGETLYAARDPYGVRPLCLGRLSGGWVVASETCALDIVGASFVREIEPGEMVTIDASGVRSQRFAETAHAGCIFEYVYLARPDSNIRGRSVNAVRLELGRQLAREFPADGDLVMPVPESGTPAAVGYAQESGIPFGQGLTKNGYVGRTFIQPSQTIRQLGIRLKLNPLKEVIAGKRLVVVDDSIVRGNTQRALIRMLREAGAKEVHVRIAAPPVKWPCFYGIDFASPGELLANGVDENDIVSGIATAIGADSLGFVSIDGMVAASEQAKSEVCCACFDGKYPLGLPEGNPNAAAVERMQAAQAAKAATSN